jgi:hypothetical protein
MLRDIAVKMSGQGMNNRTEELNTDNQREGDRQTGCHCKQRT